MWFSDDYKSCLCLWWRKGPYHTIRGQWVTWPGAKDRCRRSRLNTGTSGSAVPRAAVGVLDLRGGHRGGAPPLPRCLGTVKALSWRGCPDGQEGRRAGCKESGGSGMGCPGVSPASTM